MAVARALLTQHQHVAANSADRPSIALAIGSCALALALIAILGGLARATATVAHEGGHALIAMLLGLRITEVRVHRAGGGHTRFDAGGGGFLVYLAGYLGPSAFGLVAALLLTSVEPAALLWATLVLLGLLLFTMRGIYGPLVVLGVGGSFYLCARYGSETVQALTAFTWSWFLLIGGVIGAVELRTIRRAERDRGGRDTSSDAYHLRRLSLVPAALWAWLFVLATLAALLAGAAVLLGLPIP